MYVDGLVLRLLNTVQIGAFRWNKLHIDDLDAVHFEIIPLLIGFFTYKIASIVEVGMTAYTDLSGPSRPPPKSVEITTKKDESA